MPAWSQTFTPYAGVALALALGLLIGIERGWSHRLEPEGSRVAGVRTFGLLGLAGGLAGELSAHVSPFIGAALALAAAVALLIGYAREAARGEVSATSTIMGVITLGLGVLAVSGHAVLACVVAAVTTLMLSQRRRMHEWVGHLSETEVQAIARFGLISLAVLPLLPDLDFGPFDAWNPRRIWMVVVLVSGLSLVGYAASRRLGATRGMLATAAAGSIVSSTAVTGALAARLRQGDGDARSLSAGVALASAIMFTRVSILVAALTPFALPALLFAAAPAGLISAGFALWALRAPAAAGESVGSPAVRNPFDLGPALLLAGFVMLISLAGRWAQQAVGEAGLATVLGVSGLLDVDAAVITLHGLPAGSLTGLAAGLALAAPMLGNTLLKAGMTVAVAGVARGWRAALPLLLSAVGGVAGAAVAALLLR